MQDNEKITEAPLEDEGLLKKKKKSKARRVIKIVVLVLLLAILFVLVAAIAAVVKIHNDFYDDSIAIVTRNEEYNPDINNPEGLVNGTVNEDEILPEGWEEIEGGVTTAPPQEDNPAPDLETAPPAVNNNPSSGNSGNSGNSGSSGSSGSSGNSGSSGSSGGGAYTGGYATNYVGSIPIYKKNQIDPNVVNIVVVGRDKDSYYGRADSAIIVSYNKKTNDVKIISLMRDCYVPIEGRNWNKLGHALAYGGMGLYINTVNDVLKLDIQNYIVLDFGGLESIVNSIGGIDVNLTAAEVKYYKEKIGLYFQVGTNHMNGYEALMHARNRSLSGADFERTRRQRDVVYAIYQKAFSLGLTECIEVATSMSKYLKMNIPLTTCIEVIASVFEAGGVDMEMSSMPFAGTWKYGYAKPPGYKGYMSVVTIDISKNREQIRNFIYG